MRWKVACVAALAVLTSCSPPAAIRPKERTLWKACWTQKGLQLPSDEPPHAAPCKQWEPIKWPSLPTKPLTVSQVDGPDASTLLQATISVWNNALGFKAFVLLPPGKPADVRVFTLPTPLHLVRGVYVYTLRGITLHSKTPPVSGKLSCDVGLFGITNGLATAVHEFGHVLGLAHDLDGEYVMRSGGAKDRVNVMISRNDIAALRKLYRVREL